MRPYVSSAIVTAFAAAAYLAPPASAGDVPGPIAHGNPEFTANVMAPLKVTDWSDFTRDLKAVKRYGVDAVSVDIWWGDVETKDNRFTWSYYDRVFKEITKRGLEVAPILSFHQCGGNVGDDYTSLLPSWLWTKYANRSYRGQKVTKTGLMHRSEQGNYSKESVQGFADPLVQGEYRDFTKAFVARYGKKYAKDFTEINVSLGPSGELRYPSYNQHDTDTGYPTRGALQAYSPLAVNDLQRSMRHKYGSLKRLNRAWGTHLNRWEQVRPPRDAEDFFTSGDYRHSRYGTDFIDWYNGSLVKHGKRMLNTVVKSLGHNFPKAKVGYKVPGIHWQIEHPVHPRATEVTTGLVQTSVNENSRSSAHGYRRIIKLADRVNARGRTVTMHFTALEMGDDPAAPAYSRAKTLVGWIGQGAHDAGVELKGENALSGGVQNDFGWDQIEDAFETWGYLGLTVLRMSDVAAGTGAQRYGQFIADYRE
ncbi:family 14 glycosylhydrolase [Demetria terragena]|uniref:family 14 glycosylhydrolase n=1 Tax=Demetria terragena TaxID=63959 RepID=UPI000368B972|nr:family 14 glycosylhydrolase [Demetria terragena]